MHDLPIVAGGPRWGLAGGYRSRELDKLQMEVVEVALRTQTCVRQV